MSVVKKKRGESDMQFLDTARQLEIYTLRNCIKFPKRYTFFITNEIVRLSQSVYNNVKAANSVYVTNADEAHIRRNFLTIANCDLQALISQLDIAREMFVSEIKSTVWCKWADLIEEEAKLISALKKRDKERYKDIA